MYGSPLVKMWSSRVSWVSLSTDATAVAVLSFGFRTASPASTPFVMNVAPVSTSLPTDVLVVLPAATSPAMKG